MNNASNTAVVARPPSRGLLAWIRRSEHGSSMVEFAMCVPPLLLLITGILAFSITLSNYLVLINATGSAVLQLTMSRSQTLDPCATVATAETAAGPSLIPANLTYTTVINGTSYPGTTCASSSNTTGAAGVLMLAQGKEATVTVTYPCSLVVYGANLLPHCTLTAKSSEMIQ